MRYVSNSSMNSSLASRKNGTLRIMSCEHGGATTTACYNHTPRKRRCMRRSGGRVWLTSFMKCASSRLMLNDSSPTMSLSLKYTPRDQNVV